MAITKVKAIHPKKFPAGDKTIMLQVNGNTCQCVFKHTNGYESDTFNRWYKTLTEAKDHTRELYDQNYWKGF
jgi:hypothetical protein